MNAQAFAAGQWAGGLRSLQTIFMEWSPAGSDRYCWRVSVLCTITINKSDETFDGSHCCGVVLREVQSNTAVAVRAVFRSRCYDDTSLHPQNTDGSLSGNRYRRQTGEDVTSRLRCAYRDALA